MGWERAASGNAGGQHPGLEGAPANRWAQKPHAAVAPEEEAKVGNEQRASSAGSDLGTAPATTKATLEAQALQPLRPLQLREKDAVHVCYLESDGAAGHEDGGGGGGE